MLMCTGTGDMLPRHKPLLARIRFVSVMYAAIFQAASIYYTLNKK